MIAALPRRLGLAALAVLAALPALAQTPMSGEEFDAYTRGKTLYFYSGGVAYGVERYKADRRVTWSFLDGECKDGTWYEDDDRICFVYEDLGPDQCWTFYREDGGLRAMFQDDPQSTTLYEAGEAQEPMSCLGPEVGV
ncbi:hypothetical protein RM543_06635 [Roseicyclus sp. F158]|uniref:DUF995 domain-containing protein n=1 Tax=Tropicimonas omnivorans TaxID=3075590 RepID=A0ABU3DF66_9RHOB|nr:hypothetical protein [Roseicyclus sp. F158]MDT0682353.1 hypothetical protein [Roseicyclus sp. F158]